MAVTGTRDHQYILVLVLGVMMSFATFYNSWGRFTDCLGFGKVEFPDGVWDSAKLEEGFGLEQIGRGLEDCNEMTNTSSAEPRCGP